MIFTRFPIIPVFDNRSKTQNHTGNRNIERTSETENVTKNGNDDLLPERILILLLRLRFPIHLVMGN